MTIFFQGHYLLSAQTQADNAADRYSASLVFEVGEENLDDMDLHLSKGVEVIGKVRIADSEPAPGQPAFPESEMSLSIRTSHFNSSRGPVRPLDGGFVLEGIPLDEYQVDVFRLPEGLRIFEVRYNDRVAPYGAFMLNPEASVHRLEVILARPIGSLNVTVTDATRPAPGATVLVVPDPADDKAVSYALKRAETDADGHVTISGLFPGNLPCNSLYR